MVNKCYLLNFILENTLSLIISTSSIFIVISISPYPPIPIMADNRKVRRLLVTKCFTTKTATITKATLGICFNKTGK